MVCVLYFLYHLSRKQNLNNIYYTASNYQNFIDSIKEMNNIKSTLKTNCLKLSCKNATNMKARVSDTELISSTS